MMNLTLRQINILPVSYTHLNFPIIYLSDEQWRTQQKSLMKPYTYEENEPLYHGGIYVTELSLIHI